MFTLGVSGLVTAYILIAVLLLSINLYSNWSWPVKAATIIVTSIFYIITYISMPPILGWPTEQNPPERFRLVSAYVEQPDKLTGDEGAIYLWLTEIDDLSETSEPRAYKFPYSDPFHEEIIKAQAKLSKNILQLGEFEEPDKDAVLLENLEQKRTANVSAKISFYDMPDPLFPEK